MKKAEMASRRFGSHRAAGAAFAACLAVALTMACGGSEDDQSAQDDAAQSAMDPTLKTEVRSSVLSDSTCQVCSTEEHCEDQLGPCDPPVFVNGREIQCLTKVCTPETLCKPCVGSSPDDPTRPNIPTLPNLPRPSGNPPIDPQPFP
jgi:hypothetical protein